MIAGIICGSVAVVGTIAGVSSFVINKRRNNPYYRAKQGLKNHAKSLKYSMRQLFSIQTSMVSVVGSLMGGIATGIKKMFSKTKKTVSQSNKNNKKIDRNVQSMESLPQEMSNLYNSFIDMGIGLGQRSLNYDRLNSNSKKGR